MAVLPGVLRCRPLRCTVEVRLETNPAVARGTPSSSRSLRPLARNAHLRGLATAIHVIFGLVVMIVRNNKSQAFLQVKEKKSFPMLSDPLSLRAKGMGQSLAGSWQRAVGTLKSLHCAHLRFVVIWLRRQ